MLSVMGWTTPVSYTHLDVYKRQPITTALALLRSVKYIREGLSALWHGKLSVAVLDATAVTVSMVCLLYTSEGRRDAAFPRHGG